MPYRDGNPTLGEQVDEDRRRAFYTDDLLKDAQALQLENRGLRKAAEAALVLLEYLDQELGAALPCNDDRFDDVITEIRAAIATNRDGLTADPLVEQP